ncbi:hypothetical protein [Pseudoalteromonas piratica]|uniref:hypothetical protein n=1 Tax=Pseudoalteromonas piratica TaxID=1348114 RepID=UPI000A978D00|nr:hypothetical protein [Pseudoalteromonas piratica]
MDTTKIQLCSEVLNDHANYIEKHLAEVAEQNHTLNLIIQDMQKQISIIFKESYGGN